MARRGLPPGIASSARRVDVVRTSVGDGLAAQCAVCCLEDSRFRRSRSLPPGKSAPPAQCLACRLEDPRCRQSLKTRSPFIQCPFPALEVCRLRHRCRASPSSGSFCRKWAPNLTSSLNFWAVFGDDFVLNISDLGKRIHRRALLAVFACKTAQKFRRAHCGRLAPLRSPNPPACFATASAQAPAAGEGAFASFRPVGARAVLSARVPRAGFFRPASPFLAQLYPFESAVCRVVVFVRVCRSMPWLVHPARPSSWLL